MLREFSESASQESNSTPGRRRQRHTDSRGYETDTAVLNARHGSAESDSAKVCIYIKK